MGQRRIIIINNLMGRSVTRFHVAFLLRKHPAGLCQEVGMGDGRAGYVDYLQPCQGDLVCGAGGFINRGILLGTRNRFMPNDAQ